MENKFEKFNQYALECLDYYIDINRKTEKIFLETQDRVNFNTGDKYVDNVYLYHNIDRRYEGFIFLLEDYFLQEKSITHNIYNLKANPKWTAYEYLFLIYAHRIFGSGTSNEHNHGYHNCQLVNFQNFDTYQEYMDWLILNNENFVSCRVNQPPRYPLKQLVHDHFRPWADYIIEHIEDNFSIKQIVDVMNNYNKENNLHRFNFHYLLMAADLANYVNLDTPIKGLFNINEWSDCYLGPSSTMAMKKLCPGFKHSDFLNLAERYDMKPLDLEDLLCVWWKYIHNPIWDYYIKPEHTMADFENGWDVMEVKHKSYYKYKEILENR